MKVFISYSFQDSELYIITLLFEQLHQRGFIVESSDSVEYYGTYSANISYRILKVDYFIGIITNHSDSINAVLREWDVARNNNKPNILIIEEGVRVEYPRALNMIRFNRNNPQVAIDQLLNINKQIGRAHV